MHTEVKEQALLSSCSDTCSSVNHICDDLTGEEAPPPPRPGGGRAPATHSVNSKDRNPGGWGNTKRNSCQVQN